MEFADCIIVLILGYQNLAVQHEYLHNTNQSLLYYQIADNLLQKNKEILNKHNKTCQENIIDDYYKLKLIENITQERSDSLDKIGQFFIKKLLASIKIKLEMRLNQVTIPVLEVNENQFLVEKNEEKIEKKESIKINEQEEIRSVKEIDINKSPENKDTKLENEHLHDDNLNKEHSHQENSNKGEKMD